MKALRALFCILFVAAGAASGERPVVLVTTFPLFQIARNVTAGRDGIALELLLPAAAGCPHDYALTPEEMRRLARADALIINGLGMEEFLAAALERVGGGIDVFDTSTAVSGGLRMEGNPHLFSSPLAQGEIAAGMAEYFAELDPEGAAAYRANAERYAGEMRALAQEMKAALETFPNRRVLAQHGTFDGLARDTGLEIVGDVDETDAGASAARMRELARMIREKDVAAVIVEPQFSPRAGELLARETGIPVVLLDSGATGSEDDPPDSFAARMRENLDALARALADRNGA